jgi:DNA-binding IclR family transcriptional regulator
MKRTQQADAPAERSTVQAVTRALGLLDALADSRGEVGIADLSRRVQLHVSTVHRLLGTLLAQGYVRQNPESGRYALGARALHLADAFLIQTDLRRVVRPVLERLCRETGESANLVILDGREAMYLDKVESPQGLRIFSRIGRRAPLHCTAVGKVFLAYLPTAEAARLLGRGPLEALTPHTITSRPRLRREIDQVRAQGYALDLEECEEGGRCIAVPLRSAGGAVEAALSVSGPTVRLTPRRLEELVPLMRALGEATSAQLGGARSSPRG